MFGLFGNKKKDLEIDLPISGKVVDIAEVPDEVFSQKMMGDGVAIEPEGNVVTAPCDGQVVLLARTLHAVALQAENGAEILIHIGLDTVELDGKGFTGHVSVGDKVRRGDKLITFDKTFIHEQGKPLITPIVVTNTDGRVESIAKHLGANSQTIMQIKMRN